jgi:hypothetical protein
MRGHHLEPGELIASSASAATIVAFAVVALFFAVVALFFGVRYMRN